LDILDTLYYIKSIGKGSTKNSLETVFRLCELAGNPQDDLKIVHVAGTNGKGSVVAFVSHTLTLAGYRTGRFISPYIDVFNERISIDGAYISDDDLALYVERLKPAIDLMQKEGNMPSWFAFLTVLAFCYFKDKNCDIVVMETGIGGLYDATNVVKSPLLSVITSVGYDHTRELGNTLAEIAIQKCGIIKNGIPVITSPQKDEVLTVIEESSQAKKAPLFIAPKPTNAKCEESGNLFDLPNFSATFRSTLSGVYQIENAATAICALGVLNDRGFRIEEDVLYRGIETTSWIGRFQRLSEKPLIIADGAHNLSGMEAFCQSIDTIFPHRKKIFVLGMVADKDYTSCMKRACQSADEILAVTLNNPRALKSEDICKEVSIHTKNITDAKTAENGLKTAISLCGDDDMICICGSLFLVSESVSLWQKTFRKN